MTCWESLQGTIFPHRGDRDLPVNVLSIQSSESQKFHRLKVGVSQLKSVHIKHHLNAPNYVEKTKRKKMFCLGVFNIRGTDW